MGHLVSLLASFSRNSSFWARAIFLAVAVAAFACSAVCVPSANAADKVLLKTDAAPRHRQITTTLTTEGSLATTDSTGKSSKLPIRIAGELEFVEDTRPQGGIAGKYSLRYYRKAAGEITVNNQNDRLLLSANRQLIAVECAADHLQYTSPHGPLTRADLELLEMQFDVASLGGLISGKTVSKGDDWEISNSVAAMILGLDKAEVSSLKGAAKNITSGAVEISLAGQVEGVADGAKAKVVVDGKLVFDRRAGQFSSVTIEFRETREAAPTSPGFELQSKLVSSIAVVSNPQELSKESIATGSTQSLDFASVASEIGIVHDRTWHVTSHRRELIVLRKLDGDKQIAQCNITRLPPASGDKSLDLKQFQEQIEKALGENFGRIEEASQATGENDLEILRIVASGHTSDVPITWIYFHLAASDGRRSALVFTLTADNRERFATSDHDLIGGFRFLAAQTPEQAALPAASSR